MEEEKIFNLATDAGADDCIFYEDYMKFKQIKMKYIIKNVIEKEISNFISTEISGYL